MLVNDTVILETVMYKDKTYYAVTNISSAQRTKYVQQLKAVGDTVFVIDNLLFIDEMGLFNISLFDIETAFSIR